MSAYYYSFSRYLKERFGVRVRRLSLNAGFGCPNKDGTLSREGCVFCNEDAFTAFPEGGLPLEEQISRSIRFFRDKFRAEKFIAYFQNSSGTHAGIAELKAAYDTILRFPEIAGLSIATRPDCVDHEKLDLIAGYAHKYDVWIEYGVQSVHDDTLRRINRSHTFSQFRDAVYMTSSKGIKTAAHVILGLPGESRDDMLESASALSGLPLPAVKIHALHVLRGTRLEDDYNKGGVTLPAEDEYVRLVCDFLERLRPDMVVMRLIPDAGRDTLVAPGWINRKQEVLRRVEREFGRRGTRQGFSTQYTVHGTSGI